MDLLDDDEYLYNPYSEYSAAAGGSGGEEEASDDDGYLTDAVTAAAQAAQPQIFSLQNTQWKAKQYGGARIKHVAAASGVLYVATDRGRLVRWNLSTGDEQEIVIDPKRNDVIFKVYVDPSGLHVIIGGTQGDNWYVSVARGLKARTLPLSKRARIESVCWDRGGCDEINTGIILIGTSTGSVCKAQIVDGKEKYWKEIFSLQDAAQPICGLECEVFPASSKAASERRYLIMAATPTRYYEFIGGPTYDALFAHYVAASAGGSPCFIELPAEIDYTSLHFFRKGKGRATSFVWLTGAGVYSGNLSFGSQNAGDTSIYDYKLIPYSCPRAGGSGGQNWSVSSVSSSGCALGLLATEFHWLVLFSDRLQVIEQLSEEVVWEKVFASRHMYGDMRGILMDAATNRIWVYADYMVNEVMIVNEDHKVWRGYLAKGQYDTALQYCRDLSQREQVLTAQADDYFEKKQCCIAASIYAKTKTHSFEHVCLKLLGLGEKEAVKRYLSDKLDHMSSSQGAQLTMVCTWLLEMYLDKLNAASAKQRPDQYQALVEEVRQVVQDHVKHLDPPTTYQLMLHHGRMDVMLYYAELIGDHHRVISHHLQRREWTKALEVLAKSNDAKLYYQHAGTLMEQAPVGTTNALINATRSSSFKMEPRKLVPALMRYQQHLNSQSAHESSSAGTSNAAAPAAAPHKANQALRFLLHCVKNLKNTDPVLTKMLISLLAKHQDDEAMVAFLTEWSKAGLEGRLDLHYAYRACQAAGNKQASIILLSLMGQYAEAVERALAIHDLDLAKINADKVQDDDQVRKSLWLKIAKFVLDNSGDVKAAMALISDTQYACPLTLEDVLPLFPDFAVMDDLKEAMCGSLEDYQRHIEGLKRGMSDATKTSELIRKDMNELRSRFGFVKTSDCCRLCSTPVLSSGLYLFPCQHALHIQCVEHYMVRNGRMPDADLLRVRQLKASLAAEKASQAQTRGAQATSDYARLQAELDDLLATDCPICGMPAINEVDQPLPPLPSGPQPWILPRAQVS